MINQSVSQILITLICGLIIIDHQSSTIDCHISVSQGVQLFVFSAHEWRQTQVRALLAGQPSGDDVVRTDHVSSGKRSRLQGDELRQAQSRRNGIAPFSRPRSHHHQAGRSFRSVRVFIREELSRIGFFDKSLKTRFKILIVLSDSVQYA